MPNQMPTEIQLNHPEIVQEVDVIILGGGLAGLGAAYHLKKSSAQTFVILEANNIPGGRILAGNLHNSNMIETEKDSENVINAGAQWLHGRENPLFEIANKHGLLSDELSEEGLGVYLRNDGYRFNEFLVNKVDFIVGQILEKCESFAQNPNTQESIPKSIGSYFITEFDKRLSEFKSDHEKVLAKQLLDWHIRFQIIDNSCLSIDDVSAKSWGTYSFNGESCQAHINFKKSFYDIIEVLVEEIGKNKIKCNNTVEKICWGLLFNENNADDGKPSNMPKNLILTKNGNVFVAKHVICTFSLGVLKNKMNNMFQPQLPNTHQMAINSMGFAAIDKIFLQFDTAWWGNEKGFQLIFEDSHYENADWTRMISGFDILHPGPPNTLLCWIGGMGAIEMEKQKDEEIIDKILQLLQKFTKSHISKPINYYVTRWHTNPLVCGAYSYCSTKCDDDNILPKNLSIPVFYKNLNIKNCPINVNNVDEHTNDGPLLLFAGEACHDKYYSTAHGAFISGIEQATKVIEYIQNAK
uniref:CSON013321 protein n=1 Tax=Culicoides sonorensis TaxID=179676 RepID=A0A336KND9_CULSO